jgi:hypothetical protein
MAGQACRSSHTFPLKARPRVERRSTDRNPGPAVIRIRIEGLQAAEIAAVVSRVVRRLRASTPVARTCDFVEAARKPFARKSSFVARNCSFVEAACRLFARKSSFVVRNCSFVEAARSLFAHKSRPVARNCDFVEAARTPLARVWSFAVSSRGARRRQFPVGVAERHTIPRRCR